MLAATIVRELTQIQAAAAFLLSSAASKGPIIRRAREVRRCGSEPNPQLRQNLFRSCVEQLFVGHRTEVVAVVSGLRRIRCRLLPPSTSLSPRASAGFFFCQPCAGSTSKVTPEPASY